MKTTVTAAILASIIAIGTLLIVTGHGDGHSMTLPPCPTEDSDNCYWDADTMGNGIGTDFIVIDGTVYYPAR